MNLVFDTNIYLAAMANPEGLCNSLLYKTILDQNHFRLFISAEIFSELIEKSERLIKENYVRREDFRAIIKHIYKKTWPTIVQERLTAIKADPDDDKILECAITAQADLIISMDHHLLKLKQFRNIGIIHPVTLSYTLTKE